MQRAFSEHFPNNLRNMLTRFPSLVPVNKPVWGSNLWMEAYIRNFIRIHGIISSLHGSRSKQYKSTSATYVLGKEKSERAAGNKDINPKCKHLKHLLSYKRSLSQWSHNKGIRWKIFILTCGTEHKKLRTWGKKKSNNVSLQTQKNHWSAAVVTNNNR